MFELENITKTILSEIAMPKLKQSDIAKTYALAIKSDEKIDWSAINQAIIMAHYHACLVLPATATIRR